MIALCLPSFAVAGGPKWTYPSVRGLDDEMNNIYANIKNVPNGIYASSSMTLQGITVDSAVIHSKITIPNGAVSTDAASFGQLHLMQIPKMCTTTTQTGTTSSAYVATNLACTITPTSTSSRILVFVSTAFQVNSAATIGHTTIERGSTELSAGPGFGILRPGSTATQAASASVSFAYLDTPATTSATTYTEMIRNEDGATAVGDCSAGQTSIMILADVQ